MKMRRADVGGYFLGFVLRSIFTDPVPPVDSSRVVSAFLVPIHDSLYTIYWEAEVIHDDKEFTEN